MTISALFFIFPALGIEEYLFSNPMGINARSITKKYYKIREIAILRHPDPVLNRRISQAEYCFYDEMPA